MYGNVWNSWGSRLDHGPPHIHIKKKGAEYRFDLIKM